LRHPRLRWIQFRSLDAYDFTEGGRGYEKIALLIEIDAATVRINLFSRDLTRFDPSHHNGLRGFRIDAKNIARDPIR
jgi:hypothetical protein